MTATLTSPLPALDPGKQKLCEEFARSSSRPRFLFGRNVYANRIVEQIDVQGFIDDFTSETRYLGIPIVRLEDVPRDALVAVLSGGRPLSALARVGGSGLECIDYFALARHSGLELDEARFLEGFEEDFEENLDRYEWIHARLADEKSKSIFEKLLRFKRSYDVRHLEGFESREHEQYFEDFLQLKESGETFVDIGAYDGATSEMFMHHCPDYRAIHVFEPGEANRALVQTRIGANRDVHVHPVGLSNRPQSLRFDEHGSQSRISADGHLSIEVGRLDDLLHDEVTFIKMDIEGAEFDGLEGARDTIRKQRPRLAIGVYHRPCDIWRIPERVLAYRDDYEVRLRHYTESIYETVMFFV